MADVRYRNRPRTGDENQPPEQLGIEEPENAVQNWWSDVRNQLWPRDPARRRIWLFAIIVTVIFVFMGLLFWSIVHFFTATSSRSPEVIPIRPKRPQLGPAYEPDPVDFMLNVDSYYLDLEFIIPESDNFEELAYNGTIRARIASTLKTNSILMNNSACILKSVKLKELDGDVHATGTIRNFKDDYYEYGFVPWMELDEKYDLEIKFSNTIPRDSLEIPGAFLSTYGDDIMFIIFGSNFNQLELFPCFDSLQLHAPFTLTVSTVQYVDLVYEGAVTTVKLKSSYSYPPTLSIPPFRFGAYISNSANITYSAGEHATFVLARENFRKFFKEALPLARKYVMETIWQYQNAWLLSNVNEQKKPLHYDIIIIPEHRYPLPNSFGVIYMPAEIFDFNSTFNEHEFVLMLMQKFAYQSQAANGVPMYKTELWLVEGFADYLKFRWNLAGDIEFPDNDVMVVESLHEAMQYEFIRKETILANLTLPHNHLVKKAGCIIRMLSDLVGDSIFIKGMYNYFLKQFSKHRDTLGEAILEQVKVKENYMTANRTEEFLNSWKINDGYPLLQITAKGNDTLMHIKQERFTDPESKQLWHIPIWQDSPMRNYDERRETDIPVYTILRDPDLFFDHQGNFRDFVNNIENFGYLRINYDNGTWNRIVAEERQKPFRSEVFARLIDDSLNLAYHSYINFTVPMKLLKQLRKRHDYLPWAAAHRNIKFMYRCIFAKDEAKMNLDNFVRGLVKPLFVRLSVPIIPSFYLQKVYEIVTDLACRANLPECLKITKILPADAYTGLKNNPIRDVICCHAVRNHEAHFQKIYEHFRNVKQDERPERQFLMRCLTCMSNKTDYREFLRIEFLSMQSNFTTNEQQVLPELLLENGPTNIKDAINSRIDLAKIGIRAHERIKQYFDQTRYIRVRDRYDFSRDTFDIKRRVENVLAEKKEWDGSFTETFTYASTAFRSKPHYLDKR